MSGYSYETRRNIVEQACDARARPWGANRIADMWIFNADAMPIVIQRSSSSGFGRLVGELSEYNQAMVLIRGFA